MIGFLTAYWHQSLPLRLRMWVIWMAITRSGWVLQPQIVIVLQPFTSVLCLVVISWLSARPMHVVEHDLLMTDAPVQYGSCLSALISMAKAVPHLCISRKVFLKHLVNWNTVCGAMQDLPWRNIGLLTILLRFWTSICRCWFDVMFQPRSSMCATRMSLGLMINAGILLASRRRLKFCGSVIALGLTGKSLYAVKWELMKPTRGPSVSLVSETWMFLRMPSLLISGGPILNLLCSAWVCHCHRLLVRCWSGVRVGW